MIKDDCARFPPESTDQTKFYHTTRQDSCLFRTQKVAKVVQCGEFLFFGHTTQEQRAQPISKLCPCPPPTYLAHSIYLRVSVSMEQTLQVDYRAQGHLGRCMRRCRSHLLSLFWCPHSRHSHRPFRVQFCRCN